MATNSFSNENLNVRPGAESNTNRGGDFDGRTYSSLMKEVGISTKDLIQSEVSLLVVELKRMAQNITRDMKQAAVFGGLLALSVLPLLAFFVIGLGNLLGGQYWLSSLIVAVVCAVIGGPLCYRALKKIKEDDLQLPHMKSSLEKEVATIQRKFQDLKTTVQGDHHESH